MIIKSQEDLEKEYIRYLEDELQKLESALYNFEEAYFGDKIKGFNRILLDCFKYKNYGC